MSNIKTTKNACHRSANNRLKPSAMSNTARPTLVKWRRCFNLPPLHFTEYIYVCMYVAVCMGWHVCTYDATCTVKRQISDDDTRKLSTLLSLSDDEVPTHAFHMHMCASVCECEHVVTAAIVVKIEAPTNEPNERANQPNTHPPTACCT